jgi:hypothetical protein
MKVQVHDLIQRLGGSFSLGAGVVHASPRQAFSKLFESLAGTLGHFPPNILLPPSPDFLDEAKRFKEKRKSLNF